MTRLGLFYESLQQTATSIRLYINRQIKFQKTTNSVLKHKIIVYIITI